MKTRSTRRLHKALAAAALACLLAGTIALSACQLAQPLATLNSAPDQMVGVFVSTERLALYDHEAAFESSMNDLLNSGRIIPGDNVTLADSSTGVMNPRDDPYFKPIYAERIEETLTDDRGVETQHVYYAFTGLEGIPFFMSTAEVNGSKTRFTSDDEGYVQNVHISHADGNDALSGTIYLTPADMVILYPYPVYQQPDGQVYLADAMGAGGSADIPGASFAIQQTSSHTATEDGKTVEKSFRVDLRFEVARPTKSVTLVQMNASNQPIHSESHSIDALPEHVDLRQDAAYLLAETDGGPADGSGAIAGGKKTRSLYQPGDYAVNLYQDAGNGFLKSVPVELAW